MAGSTAPCRPAEAGAILVSGKDVFDMTVSELRAVVFGELDGFAHGHNPRAAAVERLQDLAHRDHDETALRVIAEMFERFREGQSS